MRIIARATLKAFVAQQANAQVRPALETALNTWYSEVRSASWQSTSDIKRRYRTASVISAERIVFNINGNRYRLIVAVDFIKGIVWIKWIGTHADYDRIDAKDVQHRV